jgi:hypothetical protein
MPTSITIPVALLLYPGLLTLLALGALYAASSAGRAALHDLRSLLRPPLGSSEGLLQIVSVLLAAGGLALLPWPWHPAAASLTPVAWLWAWGLLEAAFLLPLLAAMRAGDPLVVRAALTSAQVGALGRALLWLALASSLMLHANWQPLALNNQSPLLVHLLALGAAVLAFPAAVGWGPFAGADSITPGGITYGLDRRGAALARAAEHLRTAALLLAALVALLPWPLLPPPVSLGALLVSFASICLLLRQLAGRIPRLTLPAALAFCWWRALPLGVAAAGYLTVVTGV